MQNFISVWLLLPWKQVTDWGALDILHWAALSIWHCMAQREHHPHIALVFVCLPGCRTKRKASWNHSIVIELTWGMSILLVSSLLNMASSITNCHCLLQCQLIHTNVFWHKGHKCIVFFPICTFTRLLAKTWWPYTKMRVKKNLQI